MSALVAAVVRFAMVSASVVAAAMSTVAPAGKSIGDAERHQRDGHCCDEYLLQHRLTSNLGAFRARLALGLACCSKREALNPG